MQPRALTLGVWACRTFGYVMKNNMLMSVFGFSDITFC